MLKENRIFMQVEIFLGKHLKEPVYFQINIFLDAMGINYSAPWNSYLTGDNNRKAEFAVN